MARGYWLRLFRTRFRNGFSLWKPEATSLSCSSAYNKYTVKVTINNYKKALSQCSPELQASNIWNKDETELSSVHVPPIILSSARAKQVEFVTRTE